MSLTNKVIELDKDVTNIKNEIKIINPNTHIFYNGEYYKSYIFINKILKEAKKKVVIVDPYLDSSVFEYLKFIDKNIVVILIYSNKSKISNDSIEQYRKSGLKLFTRIDDTYHDRFLIIDNKTIYHVGTSLNYLGAKTFLISKVPDEKWIKNFIKNIKS